MLLATQDFKLYPEWSMAIASSIARAAFYYLLGIAASSRRFMCHAQWKGQIRDFRVIEVSSGEQPYSFIANEKWFLCYSRPAADRMGGHSRDVVIKLFDSFNENTARRGTVELNGVVDVERLSTVMSW